MQPTGLQWIAMDHTALLLAYSYVALSCWRTMSLPCSGFHLCTPLWQLLSSWGAIPPSISAIVQPDTGKLPHAASVDHRMVVSRIPTLEE